MSRHKIPWLLHMDRRAVAVVVAHQDDESIGFSSVLIHAQDSLLVHVSDGAPKDRSEWKGCETRETYGALRKQELRAALRVLGHRGVRVALDIPDGECAWHLQEIAEELELHFRRSGTKLVFTHAYEAGHPDHDAVAFAVHAAAKRIGAIRIIEAPFYYAAPGGTLWQRFHTNVTTRTAVVELNNLERSVKRRALAAHRSQSAACGRASLSTEPLREAPTYDFLELPDTEIRSHNYEKAHLNAGRWRELVHNAQNLLF